MHRVRLSMVCILALAFYFCGGKASLVQAAQVLSVGGGQARVELQFRITIPPILFLQVGQGGSTIDTIGFNLSDLPGSGRVDGDPQSIPVRVVGLVPRGQTLTLTADSASPLSNGSNVIPFSTISWRATGDFPAGGFNDRTNQKIGQWTGSGDRTGTHSFNYRNENYYPPGTYVGQVVYTLSTP